VGADTFYGVEEYMRFELVAMARRELVTRKELPRALSRAKIVSSERDLLYRVLAPMHPVKDGPRQVFFK
jgi:hypothetical protein